MKVHLLVVKIWCSKEYCEVKEIGRAQKEGVDGLLLPCFLSDQSVTFVCWPELRSLLLKGVTDPRAFFNIGTPHRKKGLLSLSLWQEGCDSRGLGYPGGRNTTQRSREKGEWGTFLGLLHALARYQAPSAFLPGSPFFIKPQQKNRPSPLSLCVFISEGIHVT